MTSSARMLLVLNFQSFYRWVAGQAARPAPPYQPTQRQPGEHPRPHLACQTECALDPAPVALACGVAGLTVIAFSWNARVALNTPTRRKAPCGQNAGLETDHGLHLGDGGLGGGNGLPSTIQVFAAQLVPQKGCAGGGRSPLRRYVAALLLPLTLRALCLTRLASR